MNETLFDQNNSPEAQSAKAAIIAKWKDKPREELENAKAESDLYIETILRRQDEINKDYRRVLEESKSLSRENNTSAQLQELKDLLEAQQNRQDTNTNVNDLERKPFDPKEFKSLITSTIREDEQERKAAQNFSTVHKKLKEEFGTNSDAFLQKQMETLGLTLEDVESLARKSPTAFFNTMGLNQQNQDSFMAPPRSQRNDSFSPQGAKKRTWSYYQEMKKTQPELYLDSKIANQMHDDMVALGDEFKDGDFNR